MVSQHLCLRMPLTISVMLCMSDYIYVFTVVHRHNSALVTSINYVHCNVNCSMHEV